MVAGDCDLRREFALTPAAVDQTLGAVHGLAAGGSLLVLTYVDRAVVVGDRSRFPEARRCVIAGTTHLDLGSFPTPDPADLR